MFELTRRGSPGALSLEPRAFARAGDVLQWFRQVLEVELVEPAELLARVVDGRAGCAGGRSHGRVGLGGICDEHVAGSELGVQRVTDFA